MYRCSVENAHGDKAYSRDIKVTGKVQVCRSIIIIQYKNCLPVAAANEDNSYEYGALTDNGDDSKCYTY